MTSPVLILIKKEVFLNRKSLRRGQEKENISTAENKQHFLGTPVTFWLPAVQYKFNPHLSLTFL